MTGNVNFETPDPSLESLSEVLSNYEEQLSAARRRGSPEDTARKNTARTELEQLLKKLAFYVTNTADGDLAVLLSSGFTVSAMPQKDDVPPMVRGVILTDGKQRGQMRLDFNQNKSAKMYEYQFCEIDPDGFAGEWSESYLTTTSRLNIIAPLKPYQRYGVRVRAVNGYGRSDWSEMVTHVVR